MENQELQHLFKNGLKCWAQFGLFYRSVGASPTFGANFFVDGIREYKRRAPKAIPFRYCKLTNLVFPNLTVWWQTLAMVKLVEAHSQHPNNESRTL